MQPFLHVCVCAPETHTSRWRTTLASGRPLGGQVVLFRSACSFPRSSGKIGFK